MERQKKIFRGKLIMWSAFIDILKYLPVLIVVAFGSQYVPSVLGWKEPILPVSSFHNILDFVSYLEAYPIETIFTIFTIFILFFLSIIIFAKSMNIVFGGLLFLSGVFD